MRRISLSVLFALIVTGTVAQADPISIQVLKVTYSTSINLVSPSLTQRTTAATGSDPVSRSLYWDEPAPPDPYYQENPSIQASATADWLAVSAALSQSSNHFSGTASADVDLMFSPLTDGIAPLGIAYDSPPDLGWARGFLFDLTTQQEVWLFATECAACRPSFTYPAGESAWELPFVSGSFTVPTALESTHVYQLHLTAKPSLFAFGGQRSSLSLTGLEAVPVPEPASLLLLGSGVTALALIRKRRR